MVRILRLIQLTLVFILLAQLSLFIAPQRASDCPSLDFGCPFNCNDGMDYYDTTKKCTDVNTPQGRVCCLYSCDEFQCWEGQQGNYCGWAQKCRLESATFARCVYLSGQGWECQ